jgi:hypothetical protein
MNRTVKLATAITIDRPAISASMLKPSYLAGLIGLIACHSQLTLCGQTPETAMTTALASVHFYIGQLELQHQLRESQLQRKFEKVQEACKKKLQEVHNGYTQVSRANVLSMSGSKSI